MGYLKDPFTKSDSDPAKDAQKDGAPPTGGAPPIGIAPAGDVHDWIGDLATLQALLVEEGVTALLKRLEMYDDSAVRMVRHVLELSRDALERDSRHLAPHLVGRLAGGTSALAQSLVAQARAWRGAPWLCPAGATLASPDSPLLHTLKGHRDFVGSLAVLPDGLHLVSASEDGTIRIWYLPDGVLLRTLRKHHHCVNAIALTQDGSRLISASDDMTLKVWRVSDWKVLHTLEGHTNFVSGVCVTPDDRVLSCSKDGTVRLWNLSDGELLHIFAGHAQWVTSVVATPDGRWAISASIDNVIKVWDLVTLSEAAPFFEFAKRDFTKMLVGDVFFNLPNEGDVGHRDYPREMAVSPDGTRLISVEHELIVWDIATRQQLARFPYQHWAMNALALMPSAPRVATGSQAIQVWDLERQEVLLTLAGHTDSVESLALTPDERLVISGSKDRTIRVWDLQRAAQMQAYQGHARSVSSLVFSADGRRVLSSGYDGLARVWDVASGRCTAVLTGHRSQFVDVGAFTSGGERAVTTSHTGEVRLWDVVNGAEICGQQHANRNYWINAFALLPDGKSALTGAVGDKLALWDLTGAESPAPFADSDQHICKILLWAEGRRAVTVAYGANEPARPGLLQGWDVAAGRQLYALAPEPVGEDRPYFSAVALLPGEERLVAGSAAGALYQLDAEQGCCLARWEAHPGCYITALSPCVGGLLSAALEEERLTIRLWDVERQRLLRTWTGDFLKPRAPVFVADGRVLVMSGAECALWDLETDTIVASFCGDARLLHASAAADGRHFALGDDAGRVHILTLL
ncbi:MAG: WD40 repeat domain-containing protein [Anaerolineae bacterium]|nr:WD40 repeat domain-containing protein [Anaerolineae bacterium]